MTKKFFIAASIAEINLVEKGQYFTHINKTPKFPSTEIVFYPKNTEIL